uniref:Uncharacterized protein n=1 Tax=Populus trichocarpa TaxID=3694 RepID=A0A3N7EZU6_POPTR
MAFFCLFVFLCSFFIGDAIWNFNYHRLYSKLI